MYAITMKRGILLAAFGSGSSQGESTLRRFDAQVRKAFPDVSVRWAFTSMLMRERLASERKKSDSVHKALKKMAFEKFTHVAVQPVHVIPGLEYGDIVSDADELRADGMFASLVVGAPLLTESQASVDRAARALLADPEILILDEATSALDPTTTQSILSLLKEINRTMGVTVIVITHEMRVIDQICDRVAVIDRGQIAELGAVSQVFTNPQSKIARELILPGVSIAPVFTPGGKRIRLAFNGETTRHPVVASLIMECQAPVNIVSADIREIDGKIYGQTILELPADEASAERARAWLKQDGVSFEEV